MTSMHAAPQTTRGAEHAHAPDAHERPIVQARPHAAQSVSVASDRSQPFASSASQLPQPGWHVVNRQTPVAQDSLALATS